MQSKCRVHRPGNRPALYGRTDGFLNQAYSGVVKMRLHRTAVRKGSERQLFES
jgi:hypothetical protein